MGDSPHIVVAGAGAIGCFVGGLLAHAGHRITLLVRPRIAAEIKGHGLTLTDFSGMAITVDPTELTLREKSECLAEADIVLVTVKSGSTEAIGHAIERFAPLRSTVVSLQNGTGNAKLLAELLPGHDVRAGMVPFNVVPMGQGGFHRATSGDIVIGIGKGEIAEQLTVPYLGLSESRVIEDVQWGKFLINLNNALNALSGLPLQAQLRQRPWRKLMADQWAEALRVLRAHGITPVSTTPVSVSMIPWILRLPTPLFTRVAASMLTIDAQARTSMAHDLLGHRTTEIDALQGEVVRMGQAAGLPTPINALVRDLIRTAEVAREGLPDLPAQALQRELDAMGAEGS